jgi:hypothetical protein
MLRTRLRLAISALLLCGTVASAELVVTVSPPKVTGQKAVVRLAMKNGFSENVESARAVVFLLNEQGKVVAQASRWVIGGSKDGHALEPKQETTFNFVVQASSPITATNLNLKVSFTRIVLTGGKLADPAKDVQITEAGASGR